MMRENGDRAFAVQRSKGNDLEQFAKTRQETTAGVEFGGRRLDGQSNFAALKVRHQTRRYRTLGGSAPGTDQVHEIVETQDSIEARKLLDSLFAPLLPL